MPTPFTSEDARRQRQHWLLDPEVTFLNHGSFGACPRPVLQAQQHWRQRLERQPVQFLARDLEALLDAAKDSLSQVVGADPEDLAFVVNATTGVNAIVNSLPWATGDEILITNHGYNACNNAVRRAVKRAGATLVVAEVALPLQDDQQVVDAVLRHTSARTKLAVLDHVTSETGFILPIDKLTRALQAKGIDTLVDGAHAPGMLDLDIRSIGCAYYTGNCHKWLCSPKGAAFLWVRRDRQAVIHPVTTSHGANAMRTDRSRFRLEFDWTGTADPSPWLCIPDAIRFMSQRLPGGLQELRKRNRALALRAREILLRELGGVPLVPDTMIGSLAAVALPDGRLQPPVAPQFTERLQQPLLEEDHIEVPIMRWPRPPKRSVRISAQIYNYEDEYVRLAAALRRHLAAGW